MEEKTKSVISCLVFVSLITGMILFIASFHYVDELEYCLEYNIHTKAMKTEITEKPGTYFLGVGGGFECFPKPRQQLEFSVRSQSQEPRLRARTKEGLSLEMDIMLEYSLRKEYIKELYDLVAQDFSTLYQLLAGSTLRNVAAKYPAMQFLDASRRNISMDMKNALQKAFEPYHADVISVQLFHVDLPDQYEGWIKQIESLKLESKRAQAYRVVAEQKETNKYTKAQIDLQTDRDKATIDSNAKVSQANLKDPERRTVAETQAMASIMKAYRQRNTTLVELDGDLQVVLAERTLNLQKATNTQNKSKVEFERELFMAKNNATVQEKLANSTAYKVEITAQAEAYEFQQAKDAQLRQLIDLKDAISMNRTQMLQFLYMSILKKSNGANFFLDYKKIPLFMERL